MLQPYQTRTGAVRGTRTPSRYIQAAESAPDAPGAEWEPCRTCLEHKPPDAFPIYYKNSRTGRTRRRRSCKPCWWRHQAHAAKRRALGLPPLGRRSNISGGRNPHRTAEVAWICALVDLEEALGLGEEVDDA